MRLPRWYTAAEIRDMFRINGVNEVYRLASEHHWRRSTDRQRPVLYRAEDVERTIYGDTPTGVA